MGFLFATSSWTRKSMWNFNRCVNITSCSVFIFETMYIHNNLHVHNCYCKHRGHFWNVCCNRSYKELPLLSKLCGIQIQILHNSATEIQTISQTQRHSPYGPRWDLYAQALEPAPRITDINFTFSSRDSWFYAFLPSFFFHSSKESWHPISLSIRLMSMVRSCGIRNRDDNLHRQCLDKFWFYVQTINKCVLYRRAQLQFC